MKKGSSEGRNGFSAFIVVFFCSTCFSALRGKKNPKATKQFMKYSKVTLGKVK